jgi:TetR/AcrR family transcriptional regulator
MPKPVQKKRGQGRPTDGGVGRQAIIDSVRKILRELSPSRITISLVAREAGVDPALVRYYFKDRSNLLLEVVNDLLKDHPPVSEIPGDPAAAMKERVRQTHKFASSAKHMQRLMIDELVHAKSETVREKHRQINLHAIAAYRELMERDGGATMRQVDPFFLYLAIVGIFDFFVSAEPMIRSVAPAGTDMKELASKYTDFVADLLLNGLLNRPR